MKLVKDQLSEISYECRPRGYDKGEVESGIVIGRWTGEIDTWGKHTITLEDRDEILYLFADEIIEVEPYGEDELHGDRMRLVSVKAEERTTLATQCRRYSEAVKVLHIQHDRLMQMDYFLQARDRENLKKALAKVRGLEAVIEARLRGL